MIEKRRSPIQGWGVFATQPITKNTRIIEYTGEKTIACRCRPGCKTKL